MNLTVNTGSDKITKNEYGQANMMGIELQFSKILGDVVVENYLKTISDEDMALITEYMTKDLFSMVHDFESEDPKAMKKVVKSDWSEPNSGGWGSRDVKSVGSEIKEMFNSRVKDELKEKMTEIIKSKEYSEKIDMIANEVVDYCINGYKEDLKNSIREKLIGNIMSNDDCYYGGTKLNDAIRNAVDNYLNFNR